ncbi:triose-phosphate isomerase [Limosilactobacillus ingluviei]|uniref:triose-phosphate isomerase n=1 Tax=Limosilactobacillus ingluviei TaxID=148604 RepID=UPI0002D709B7|nr:triose-phosphate isomerase [Limosilactobacillus ingluviei]MBM6727910.1 triose-phosphate isomerase [Limosilactobacillus ingluviei]
MRKPFIAANWKMHKTVEDAVKFVEEVQHRLPSEDVLTCGIAAHFLALYPMVQKTKGINLGVIAQNSYGEFSGPYTGEVSPRALAAAGVQYVMCGHIERRTLFHEDNAMVAKKVAAVLQCGMTPIICTDETMVQQEFNGEVHYVFAQLMDVLSEVSFDQVKNIIISYEPSWAVGVGQHANPTLAEEGCRLIRRSIADTYSYEVADKIRILYGGSVNPENIQLIMSKRDIDGVLIGRASLDADNFLTMVDRVAELYAPQKPTAKQPAKK